MKTLKYIITLLAAANLASAQSPAAEASAKVGAKSITIKYSAPSVRGRNIFAPDGVISKDGTYPVWRAGANAATALHTDADLDIGGLNVPKGDYTLYISVKDPNAWELVVSKETGQEGSSYDPSKDLGRVKMTMSKPPAMVETLKYSLPSQGGNKLKLQLDWENRSVSVPVTVK